MKLLFGSLAAAMIVLTSSAFAQSLTSKSSYEYDQNQLSDPWLRNRSVEACSHGAASPQVLEQLSKAMSVPVANVRYEFCRRIGEAYAHGQIPYDDYVQFTQNHRMTASIAKALRISPQAQGKRHAHG